MPKIKQFIFISLLILTTIPIWAESNLQQSIANFIPKWSTEPFAALQIWQWIGIGAAIFLGLAVKLIVQLLVSIIHKFVSKKTETVWDDKLISAFRGPTGYIAAIGSWIFFVSLLKFGKGSTEFITDTLQVALGVVFIWLAYRLVNVFIEFVESLADKTKSTLDDQLIPILSKTLKALVVGIGTMIILQNFGINVLSLLAGLGIGGLAFALAAKDTASNIFGSITIFSDRPFILGDWVRIGSAEGIVEEIGIRSTRIRTFAKTQISIPNSVVANSTIINVSKRDNYRRVSTTLGLTYDTPPEKMKAFTEGVKNIIIAHPDTHKDNMHVYFVNYGAFSLDVMVYFFLNVADWTNELMGKQDILLQIMRLAKDIGVDFAYPTQSLHIETFPEKQSIRAEHQINLADLEQKAASYKAN